MSLIVPPPGSSLRAEVAPARIHGIMVANSFPLCTHMPINPSILGPMPGPWRLLPSQQHPPLPLLFQSMSVLASQILLRLACVEVFSPRGGRGKEREATISLSSHCKSFSQQPSRVYTNVIPMVGLRKLRLCEVGHLMIERETESVFQSRSAGFQGQWPPAPLLGHHSAAPQPRLPSEVLASLWALFANSLKSSKSYSWLQCQATPSLGLGSD